MALFVSLDDNAVGREQAHCTPCPILVSIETTLGIVFSVVMQHGSQSNRKTSWPSEDYKDLQVVPLDPPLPSPIS